MKEFFHGGIIPPFRREGLEAGKSIRMQMADLGKIALVLEDIGVQQTGIRVFDRQFSDDHLCCARRDIGCFRCLDRFHFVAVVIVSEAVVTDIASRQAV